MAMSYIDYFSPRIKRKVFVSYHHGKDQYYYNEFSRIFAGTYEILRDNSLDRRIDSDNADYVIRCIRENYITGSSCTFVLCGSETPWRKFVDWEIKATLDAEHGLVGVNLPTNLPDAYGKYTVPDRLHDNIESGYALWSHWDDITGNPQLLSQRIEEARTKPSYLIVTLGFSGGAMGRTPYGRCRLDWELTSDEEGSN